MIISPQIVQDLQAQFNMDFQAGFQAANTERWKEKAYRATSNAYRTVHSWLAAQPEMRQWAGARVINNLVNRAYELKNLPWEYTFGVDADDIFYDNLSAYGDRGRIAGEVAARWPEKLVTDAMIAGNTTTCWDGQSFYSAAHPVNIDDSGAGTYSNSYTADGALTFTSLWAKIAAMMSFKNENGLPMEVIPSVLEVPPNMALDGATALAGGIALTTVQGVQGTPPNVAAAGVNNQLPNALQSIGGVMQLVVNPRLSASPDVYYIHSTNLIKPFIFQVAKDPTSLISVMDPSNPEVFHNKRFLFGTDAKGVAAGTLPFLSIRVSRV